MNICEYLKCPEGESAQLIDGRYCRYSCGCRIDQLCCWLCRVITCEHRTIPFELANIRKRKLMLCRLEPDTR